MSKSVLLQPLKVFFGACMRGLMPLRRRGAFGTSDEPLYFDSGDRVPWFVEARWPLNIRITFGCNVETYFDGSDQVVRPVRSGELPLMYLGEDGKKYGQVLVVGAPTLLDLQSRPRPPRRLKRLAAVFVGR